MGSTDRPLRQKVRSGLRKAGLLEFVRGARLRVKALRAFPRNWPYLRSKPADGLPLPPVHLVQAVSGEADYGWFLEGGARGAASIRSALANSHSDLSRLGSLLDFGCGCGRVVRHWAKEGVEVHGTDYNPELVEWCRRALAFGRFEVNGLGPPLGYGDASFGLVYALSVFTHLPEELQLPWIRELRRVVRPEGLVILSLHGSAYRDQLSPAERASFDSGSLVVRRDDSPGSNVCGAYHPEAYVRGTLAEGFAVVGVLPEGALGNPRQDLVVLQRRN